MDNLLLSYVMVHPAALNLQIWPLYVLQQIMDWVGSGIDQVTVLVLVLGGNWVCELTSSPSSLPPERVLQYCPACSPNAVGSSPGATFSAVVPSGLTHLHLYHQDQLYCPAHVKCRGHTLKCSSW